MADSPHSEHSIEPDALFESFRGWVGSERGSHPSAVETLAGDVSARRYFRVHFETGAPLIGVYYPAEVRPTCEKFLTSGRLLEQAGVQVPSVLAVDCTKGFMLVEDLGTTVLYGWRRRSWETLTPYFHAALRISEQICALPPEAIRDLNPPLDAATLRAELETTWNEYLKPNHMTGNGVTRQHLRDAFDELCHSLTREPPIPCHRDFMARNLVPIETTHHLAVLDHQDLRLGPTFYDLASLFNDSLFPPDQLVDRWLGDRLSTTADRLSYHRAAAQRTLKAVGTYARFANRGMTHHLPLISPTLGRALRHLRELSEFGQLASKLNELWQPGLEHTGRTIKTC